MVKPVSAALSVKIAESLSGSPFRRIAYDCKLMRPGCVIIQAAFGVAETNVANAFDTKDWLLAPTDDMRVYPLAPEPGGIPLERLVEMTRNHRGGQNV